MTSTMLKTTAMSVVHHHNHQQHQQGDSNGYEYSYNEYERQHLQQPDDEYYEYDDVDDDDDDYECDEQDYFEYNDDDDGSFPGPEEEEQRDDDDDVDHYDDDDDDYQYGIDEEELVVDQQQQQQQQRRRPEDHDERHLQQLSLLERFQLFRQNRNDRWYEITKNHPELNQHFQEASIGVVQHNLYETKACHNLVPLPSSSSSPSSLSASSWLLGGTAQIDQFKLDKLLGSGDYHYRYFRGWGEEVEPDDDEEEISRNISDDTQQRKRVTWADQCSTNSNNSAEEDQQLKRQQQKRRRRRPKRTKQVTIKVFAKRRSSSTEADLEYIQESTARMGTEISILQAYANQKHCINLLGFQSVIHSPKNIYMILDQTDCCLESLLLINNSNKKSSLSHRRRLLASEPESIKNIVVGLLNAVRFLHSKGIYHLDIKPTNIFLVDLQQQQPDNSGNMIVPSSSVRLCGLSSKVYVHGNNDNSNGEDRVLVPRRPFVGYPGYAAPELVAELPTRYPDKCDIWSVGCILLAMMRSTTASTNNKNSHQHPQQGQLPPQMERDFHLYGRGRYEKELSDFLNRAKRRYSASSPCGNSYYWNNAEEEEASCCCFDFDGQIKITAAERKKIAKDLLYNCMLRFEADDRATIETIMQHKYFE